MKEEAQSLGEATMPSQDRGMGVLILGAGYLGRRLAVRARAAGRTAWTLRRTAVPGEVHALVGDLTRPETLAFPGEIDRVVFCAGLQRAEPEAYRALFLDGLPRLLGRLKRQDTPPRFLFTSTTGAYGVTDGSWVDETTPAHPARETARIYREAESAVLGSGLDAVVLRLSGIYGPGRCRWVAQLRDGQARRYPGPPRYMNHIHVEDAAGAILHLLALPAPEPLYIASDHEPVDRNLFLEELARQIGRTPPPFLPDTEHPPLGRGGNKRCDSSRLRATGYTFLYPTFREGYASLMDHA